VIIDTYVCRYGMAYALHRLPAVASIMLTQEYLEFAQQVMSSHDKADKQAELDVSASMGEMLQEMQACLTQLCGSSAVGDPEAVARMIAENISAKNISPNAGHASEDLGEIFALPPSAAKQDVIMPDMPANAKRLKAITAPTLYDTSGSINTVLLAWQEWNSGPAQTTIAQRVLEIKAHKHMSMGRRNVHLHKKNRHLPQLIEYFMHATSFSQMNHKILLPQLSILHNDNYICGSSLICASHLQVSLCMLHSNVPVDSQESRAKRDVFAHAIV